MSKAPPKDIEMVDNDASKAGEKPSASPKPQVPLTPTEEIKSNITLIERAVSTLEPRFTHKVLRSLTHLRRKLDEKVLRSVINEVYVKGELFRLHRTNSCPGRVIDGSVKKGLLSWLPESTEASMEIDTSVPAASRPKPTASPTEPLPETEIYLRLLIIYRILDTASGLPRRRAGEPEPALSTNTAEAYAKAKELAHETVEKIHTYNRRSLDPISAKLWFAIGRVYELNGSLNDVRP